jgi:hypothetical protein
MPQVRNRQPQGADLMNDGPLLVVTAPGDKNIPMLAELRQVGTVVARGFGSGVRPDCSRCGSRSELVGLACASPASVPDIATFAPDPFPVGRFGTDALA